MTPATRRPGPGALAVGGLLGLGAVAAVVRWARNDYREWLALGDSGLPPTVVGWLRVIALRVPALLPADPRRFGAGPAHPLVDGLAPRTPPTPTVARHLIPHRVVDMMATPVLVHALETTVADMAARPGYTMRTAAWERHNPGLWTAAGTEIGHVHPTDGSSHLVLTPPDARVVVERRWGVLHPLAGRGGLPRTYTLVYPPRDGAELAAVRAIYRATAEQALASEQTQTEPPPPGASHHALDQQ